MKTLTAVLFVGGESRRMGLDKATLIFGGEPLWTRQLRILRELQPEKILISARTKPAWCPADVEVVLDEPQLQGPLSGLVAVMRKMETTHLLALAVDMPLMSATHLTGLFARAQMGCGVVVNEGDYYEPLAATYPQEARTAVVSFADHGGSALQPLIAGLVEKRLMLTVRISRKKRKYFQNTNTQHEFVRTAVVAFQHSGKGR